MSFEIFEEVEKTMDTRITELLEEIKKAIDKAATTGDKYQFIDPVFDLTDELEQCETPFDAVRPILELIESSPNIENLLPILILAVLGRWVALWRSFTMKAMRKNWSHR